MRASSDVYFGNGSGRGGINGLFHYFGRRLNAGPTGRRQCDDCKRQPVQILLVNNVLVSGDKNLEAFTLRRGQQFSVGELTPTPLLGGLYLMGVEEIS